MKNAITILVVTIAVVPFFLMFFEPERISALTDDIKVSAEVSEEISLSSPGDVALASSIPGMTGNPGSPASGSATWTVITSNATGFNMKVKASGETGMVKDADWYMYAYTPAVAGSADYTWASPAVGSAEYGFSVTAETVGDIDTPFTNNGASCGNGGNNTDNQCWYPFSLVDLQVINRTSATGGGGEDEKINFRAESNGQMLEAGFYDSYLVITAVTN